MFTCDRFRQCRAFNSELIYRVDFFFQVSRFSKCNKCIEIKTKLSSNRNKTKKQELQRRREKHLKQQKLAL